MAGDRVIPAPFLRFCFKDRRPVEAVGVHEGLHGRLVVIVVEIHADDVQSLRINLADEFLQLGKLSHKRLSLRRPEDHEQRLAGHFFGIEELASDGWSSQLQRFSFQIQSSHDRRHALSRLAFWKLFGDRRVALRRFAGKAMKLTALSGSEQHRNCLAFFLWKVLGELTGKASELFERLRFFATKLLSIHACEVDQRHSRFDGRL